MADDDSSAKRLAELEERLQKARPAGELRANEQPPTGLGMAYRVSIELVAAVFVGSGIGWALDRAFGTSPLFLIVLFFFGVVAGILNVYRATKEMNENPRGKSENGS